MRPGMNQKPFFSLRLQFLPPNLYLPKKERHIEHFYVFLVTVQPVNQKNKVECLIFQEPQPFS